MPKCAGQKRKYFPGFGNTFRTLEFFMEEDGSNQQLYNVDKDHRESVNHASGEKAVSRRLFLTLNKWYKEKRTTQPLSQ